MGTVKYNDALIHKEKVLEDVEDVDHGWLTVLVALRRLTFTTEYSSEAESTNIPYGQQLVDPDTVPTIADLLTNGWGQNMTVIASSWVVMLQCAAVADSKYDANDQTWLDAVKAQLAVAEAQSCTGAHGAGTGASTAVGSGAAY